MLVDTTIFDWVGAALDAGLFLSGTLLCIALATHAGRAARSALPAARETMWRTIQTQFAQKLISERQTGEPDGLLNF